VNTNSTPCVAILLATYNGQVFLPEQLNSFLSQTHSNWKILASDDGSCDQTLTILEQFRMDHGTEKLSIVSGPGKGFVANFFSMVCSETCSADYYAFSDQDDVWENDKLQRAIDWLKTIPNNTPALYCARTRLVDQDNREIGLSPLFPKKPCFENALVQSIAGGNTMVFNDAARCLFKTVSDNTELNSHDWWYYIIITGLGGQFFYDHHCSLRYRQHSGNLTGMNTSFSAKLFRIRMLFEGRFKKWNDENMMMLAKSQHLLTPENKIIFDRFVQARKSNLFSRLIVFFIKIKIHRQTFFGNIALIAAAIVNKV